MIENFQLFLNVIVYFLNFSGIICMMFVITIDFNYFNMMTQLLDNWSLGFITDVKMQIKLSSEKENICPEHYEYMFSFTWPGTKAGCNCLNVFNMTGYSEFENKLLVGACSLMLSNLGCETVAELPSKTLHAVNDTYFCVKRNEFDYFKNYQESIYEQDCPKNLKSCGSIDSVGNILCIAGNSSCPIEQIDSNSVVYDYNENSPSPDLINKFSKYFLQFKISQGNVCINNDELDIFSNVYELFKNKKSIRCSTKLSDNNFKYKYDYRYQPLSITVTKKLFYKEDFLKSNIKSLPNFPEEFLEDLVILYGRNYIGWKKKCKDYIHNFKEIHEFALNIEKYSIFYLVYSLIMLIYCMLFIMIFKELLFEQYTLKILIIAVHLALIVFIFALVLRDNLEISRAIELCFIIIKKRCSDEETNRLIIYVLKSFEHISSLFNANLMLYIITIVLSCVKIMLTLYKIYKKNILLRVMQGNVNEFEMVLLI